MAVIFRYQVAVVFKMPAGIANVPCRYHEQLRTLYALTHGTRHVSIMYGLSRNKVCRAKLYRKTILMHIWIPEIMFTNNTQVNYVNQCKKRTCRILKITTLCTTFYKVWYWNTIKNTYGSILLSIFIAFQIWALDFPSWFTIMDVQIFLT